MSREGGNEGWRKERVMHVMKGKRKGRGFSVEVPTGVGKRNGFNLGGG